MIYIQSESNDNSTNDVLDWLYYLGIDEKEIIRLNDKYILDKFSIAINNNGTSTDISGLHSEEIRGIASHENSYWYRRGKFTSLTMETMNHSLKSVDQPDQRLDAFGQRIDIGNIENTINFLNTELNTSGFRRINNSENNKLDNLHVLQLARDAGLIIPNSIFTNDYQSIIDFCSNNQKIAIKYLDTIPVRLNWSAEYGISIGTKTTLLDSEVIKKNASQKTAPCFLQEYIKKRYELRAFYLNGKFYSMAIFSQANQKTEIDFRNYDQARPNRCVPYKLPEIIEQKLDNLMKAININCGSIDLIYTPNGKYVFLEVNPVGQFQSLSKKCNYDIERTIAKTLLPHD